MLAYHQDVPVGWCSMVPRESYATLDRSAVLPQVDDQPVWSVVCFFLDRHHRGRVGPPARGAGRPGAHVQGRTDQAKQDHEPACLGAGEQEPRGGDDHHEQVKAAESGAPVVLEMADVHYVVDSEHQPGADADHNSDPIIGFWSDDERQDGRHDDRQAHRGVEGLEEGGVAFRAGLAWLVP